MKRLDLLPSEDNLENTLLADSIGRNIDLINFVRMLNTMNDSSVIAIDAKWGEGKTFFIKQAKMIIENKSERVNKYIQRETSKIVSGFEINPSVCVYYDSWENDNDTDPVLSIVYSILKEIPDLSTIDKERDFGKILTSIGDFVSGKNITELFENIRGVDQLSEIRKNKSLKQQIDDFIESIFPERGDRLFIFIDELDRCNPDYAVKLLERIKHYFDNDRVTFIFAINSEQLIHTIKKHYGNGFDAYRYLDRFFDIRVSLPPIDMDKFYRCIGLDSRSWVYNSICKIVSEKLEMGMREKTRFIANAKLSASKVTCRDNNSNLFLFDDGKAREFCYCCIVPIIIGLHSVDKVRYEEFISGKNGDLLYEIFDGSYASGFMGYMLSQGESYTKGASETTVVSLKDKLKELYRLIFIEQYDTNYEQSLGCMSFSATTKNDVLRVASGVSIFADY